MLALTIIAITDHSSYREAIEVPCGGISRKLDCMEILSSLEIGLWM